MTIKTLEPGTYKTARGQVIIKLLTGALAGRSFVVGDTDMVRNITTEYAERYTNEFAVKTLAFKDIDQLTAELTITAYQAGKVAQMIAHMSDAHAADQAAAQDITVTVSAVSGDEVIRLDGARRVTNVIVSDGDGEVYEEGVNYTVHTGENSDAFVSLISKPAGAGPDVQVDFDRQASKGTRYYFGELSEILAEVIYLENVKSAPGRSAEMHVYHRVGLKVDGDYTLIGSDSGPRTVTIKGTIYPDTTKPEGQHLGYIDTNVASAA